MKFLLHFVLCAAVGAQLTTPADVSLPLPLVAFDLLVKMLPFYQFNEECVANDCPELKGLCPKVNDKDSLVKVINTANGCMTKSVCGLVQDPNAVPTLTFDSTMWPVYHETRTCTVDKGGELSHTSQAQVVDVTRSTRVHLTMSDITAVGDITCGDNQATIHYDHLMKFNCTIAITPILSILTVNDPKWTFNSLKYDITTANGTVTKDKSQFDPNEIKIEETALQTAYSIFLQRYYQTAFDVAKQNCPQ